MELWLLIGILAVMAFLYGRERAQSTVLRAGLESIQEQEENGERPYLSKDGIIRALSEQELRYIAAERNLFCGNRQELIGLAAAQGFVMIPSKEFQGAYLVQEDGWNQLITALQETRELVRTRNIQDKEFRRDWLDGKDV